MKPTRMLLPLLLLVFFLAGCTHEETPTDTTAPSPASGTTLAVPEEPTEASSEAPTEPEHSQFYVPGVSVEDVILYFNEVCLDAEFSHSGDASLLQKWTDPIRYTLYGDYTDEDYATLTGFCHWLNQVDGFPGIYETDDPSATSLRIYFGDQEEMITLMGDTFTGMDGAVTFWYDGENEIYDAIICYRNDLDQYLRNSVILEEIYNGLGPIQDTALRPDSIIYAEFSQPQALTDIDELILHLLYHPQIQTGMNAKECEAVIRQLYY